MCNNTLHYFRNHLQNCFLHWVIALLHQLNVFFQLCASSSLGEMNLKLNLFTRSCADIRKRLFVLALIIQFRNFHLHRNRTQSFYLLLNHPFLLNYCCLECFRSLLMNSLNEFSSHFHHCYLKGVDLEHRFAQSNCFPIKLNSSVSCFHSQLCKISSEFDTCHLKTILSSHHTLSILYFLSS